jgi:hypothetical protein
VDCGVERSAKLTHSSHAAHLAYARYLLAGHRFDAAFVELRRAVEAAQGR